MNNFAWLTKLLTGESVNRHLVDRAERAEADRFLLRRTLDRIEQIIGPEFGEPAIVESVRNLKARADDANRLELELNDVKAELEHTKNELDHLKRSIDNAIPQDEDRGFPQEMQPQRGWFVFSRTSQMLGELRFYAAGPPRATLKEAREDVPAALAERVLALRTALQKIQTALNGRAPHLIFEEGVCLHIASNALENDDSRTANEPV